MLVLSIARAQEFLLRTVCDAKERERARLIRNFLRSGPELVTATDQPWSRIHSVNFERVASRSAAVAGTNGFSTAISFGTFIKIKAR
jgi:hypothetical protein